MKQRFRYGLLWLGLIILPGCSSQDKQQVATAPTPNLSPVNSKTPGKPRAHQIIYKVQGAAGSQFVWIKCLTKPIYDDPTLVQPKPSQMTSVRVAASALPWSKTVSLPDKAMAWVWVSNENKQKSHLSVAIVIDGQEFSTKPINPAPIESLYSVRVVGESCCS